MSGPLTGRVLVDCLRCGWHSTPHAADDIETAARAALDELERHRAERHPRPEGPCTRTHIVGAAPTACPACGHARVLHPGHHNPALDACLACTTTRPDTP